MKAPGLEKTSGVIQASTILFASTMASNVINYLYHALAGRVLGPAGYGALVSLLSLITVLFIPGQAIQMVIAREVATEALTKNYAKMRLLVEKALIRVLILGSGLCLALVVASSGVAGFLQLHNQQAVVAAGLVILVVLLLPVIRGLLQGLQNFAWLGINIIADAVFRLAAGALFFALGWGVSGGVLAGGVGGVIAGIIVIVPMRWMWRYSRAPKTALDFQELYRYGVPVVATFGAFTALYTLDVMMVKHYLTPAAAGYYSSAVLIGKAFLFLPYATAQVLFPKVSVGHSLKRSTWHLLQQNLLLTGSVLLLGIIAVWFSAPLLIMTLFGKDFLHRETIMLARAIGVAISPLALMYILLQYHLARKNVKFALLLLIDIPVFVLALALRHGSGLEVLIMVGINHWLLFLCGYGITWKTRHGIS